MRLVFAGTPAFAAQSLAALHDAGHAVQAVLTQPDRPAGRGLKLQASPVKQWAQARGLPVFQPRSLRLDGRWPADAAAAQAQLVALQPELIVVAAYGLLLPAWVLDLPTHGCLNIHASLLPRWRGAAPIQRAIEAGDTHTGITIMQMDLGLDTGDICLAQSQPIFSDDTSQRLQDRLAAQGAQLIVQAVDALQQGHLNRRPQPGEGANYAAKIDKGQATIDWHDDATAIERRVRAFNPAPGCHFRLGDQTVKLWQAKVSEGAATSLSAQPPAAPGTVLACRPDAWLVQCGQGVLQLLSVQAPGGRRQVVAEFLNGPLGRTLRPGQAMAHAT
jgi:methionyl-tRNA formyltransferase